jgi:hypothetical protein
MKTKIDKSHYEDKCKLCGAAISVPFGKCRNGKRHSTVKKYQNVIKFPETSQKPFAFCNDECKRLWLNGLNQKSIVEFIGNKK